ncbi:hypothetical protein ASPZODRAFT_57856, partial [Penicilliopsis zonata CBS 506.65]
LAQRITSYALTHLPERTYNHSLRVYYFGLAIKASRFPGWLLTDETFFLACLLHDIGTTDAHLENTRLSFEYYGGFLALEGDTISLAPRDQAESIAEAIIRHQDLRETGSISSLGQLIQLATLFDNTGSYPDLVHETTIQEVNIRYPRHGWSGCFADTIDKEIALKPWAHTTVIEGFKDRVLNNTLMNKYE